MKIKDTADPISVNPSPCPGCGRCPTCGRGYEFVPAPINPWPGYPRPYIGDWPTYPNGTITWSVNCQSNQNVQ